MNHYCKLEDVFDIVIGKNHGEAKYAYIELSINLPPTKKYMSLSDTSKREVYLNLMTYLKLHAPFSIEVIDYEFEYGNDTSKLHLHSHLKLRNLNPLYVIEGVVMDIVRIIKSQMIYSHKNINMSNYHDGHGRFKDNLLCVQYRDKPRQEWDEYIKKTRVYN